MMDVEVYAKLMITKKTGAVSDTSKGDQTGKTGKLSKQGEEAVAIYERGCDLLRNLMNVISFA